MFPSRWNIRMKALMLHPWYMRTIAHSWTCSSRNPWDCLRFWMRKVDFPKQLIRPWLVSVSWKRHNTLRRELSSLVFIFTCSSALLVGYASTDPVFSELKSLPNALIYLCLKANPSPSPPHFPVAAGIIFIQPSPLFPITSTCFPSFSYPSLISLLGPHPCLVQLVFWLLGSYLSPLP